MKKTVDLGEMPKNIEPAKETAKADEKPYYPCLYISGKRVEDMPAEGTATITYKLRRSTTEYGEDGKSSVDIEVQDITYNPVDPTAIENEEEMEGPEAADSIGEKTGESEGEEESEGKVEIKVKTPVKGFSIGKKVKIDSSKGTK